ncbi:unnamed protein product [Rodentolepis nana]|uniref:Similar to n=1 Tax=Rodentolepis nana TaxID=102285 RepID=A0A0R3TSE9_RODNA|nr:unnamed protein product [Rodentolepis nana]
MACRRPVDELADVPHRNPNGLQPCIAFPEDYISPGNLHYNVPPIPVDRTYPLNTSIMPWHGYTGAKGHFNEQVMPSWADQYVINDNEVGRNVNIEQCKLTQQKEFVQSKTLKRKLSDFHQNDRL